MQPSAKGKTSGPEEPSLVLDVFFDVSAVDVAGFVVVVMR
jgi:hypothetical protein